MKRQRVIVWFRQDLRMHDNEALIDALRSAEEADSKFSTNETSVANAGQENQKQITDAAREGSIADQDQVNDQSEQRQEQLANWEDMAPREDDELLSG